MSDDVGAFPVQPTTSRTAIRVVLIAGAGSNQLARALQLLDQLPELRIPVIVSFREAAMDGLQARVDGVDTRWVTHGAALGDASLWIAPSDQHTLVRGGRFELSGPDGSPAKTPSLGKLYHSLRVEYGSRVFAVVIDEQDGNCPTLRLLAQRGASVVSPLDCGPDDVARHWSSSRIAAHLAAELAATPTDTATQPNDTAAQPDDRVAIA